jgi:UDP-N-acetylmuramoylalanine--D-glutamate ligase
VVVLGIGRQGRALGRWLPTIGARVTLSDSRPAEAFGETLAGLAGAGVALALGGHPLALLDDGDVLCVSGGVPLTLPIVQEALRRGVRVTNDAQLFLERCPAPLIGITGSAGKTTTTALTGEMGRCAGLRTFVGGNIGDVLLDDLAALLPTDLVVMELSSFQLELMTVSPPVAGLLNVTPNHLDRHGTMEAYIAAKARIYTYQDTHDIAVFGRDNPQARAMSAEAPGRMAEFSMRERVLSGAYLYGDELLVAVGDSAPGMAYEVVCARSAIRLRGDHNVLNTLAACALAGAARLPVEAMRAAIEAFAGVEHRLETVAVIGGVTWVNDSIATAPERVVAALHSYTEPVVLLAGGRDKDLLWAEMAALATTRCPAVICFGEYGPQVAEHMEQARLARPGALLERVEVVSDLGAAVARAQALARPGDVVLLSPGGTSYDAYTDFAGRGQHFRDLVRDLGA